MSLETVCFSMYSLMSRRIMASSVPKNVEARVLQSAVLPTPVGPENMKPAIGRSGFLSPARARRKARETLCTASSWPMMLRCNSASSCRSREDSEAPTCSTAMPVQPATTCATSSSVTSRPSSAVALSACPPVTLESCCRTSTSRALSSCASAKRSATAASCICAFSARSSSMRRAAATEPWLLGPCSRRSRRSKSPTSRNFSCCASS
mmetsp:Transcript_96585/g.268471  ORF Transcript_96585/g.268471 Transcript_96585/m.268471 type:complete len:208 (-) Transcript_96585:2112-2735(-)